MATTYNFTDGSLTLGAAAVQQNAVRQEFQIIKNRIDFSLGVLDQSAGDLAQALLIPAGTTVLTCYIRVITAETANGSVDIGVTGGNVDQWGDGVSLAAVGVVGGLFAPLYFAAADTIDLLATADGAAVDIDGAVIEVYAVCINHAI